MSTAEAEYKVQNLSAKAENVPQVEAVESRNDEWYSTLKFGQHLVKLKLDTGVKCNMLPNHLFNKITEGKQQVSKSNTKLISYSGKPVQTVGQAIIECYYKNTKYNLLFFIAQKDVKPILGLPDYERMGMVKRIIDVSSVVSSADIFNDYFDLFDGKLGCLPVQYHNRVDPTVKPVIDPAR